MFEFGTDIVRYDLVLPAMAEFFVPVDVVIIIEYLGKLSNVLC